VSKAERTCVLFFVKYPEKGKVKRRLAITLGERVTVKLYQKFVLDSLSMLERSGVTFLVCCDPPDSQDKFGKWLGTGYSYLPQRGADLGQRMKNGFVDTFHCHYRQVVIIGSDSPDLPAHFINEALSSLKTHDVVIGPSFDGGYYLIGFNYDTFLPEAFDEIDWGTDTVFTDTLKIVKNSGCTVRILSAWHDIDTYDDLRDLITRNLDTEFRHSITMAYLSGLDGVVS